VTTAEGWQNWTIVVFEDLRGVDKISSSAVQDVFANGKIQTSSTDKISSVPDVSTNPIDSRP
jgi:hypothetical protein